MDLQWHIRLVERLIKNNPDATIKDYYRIVDFEVEKNSINTFERMKNEGAHIQKIIDQPLEIIIKPKRPKKVNNKFDLEKFMQENPDYAKRRENARARREWFKKRNNGIRSSVKMKYNK